MQTIISCETTTILYTYLTIIIIVIVVVVVRVPIDPCTRTRYYRLAYDKLPKYRRTMCVCV